ncbi:MvdD family ATP-grasp ribosomal peptide maturase [Flavobacterium supellecticarium]|uniref:MvdD family ATP-grasp ribosomal peptide maturase n=1 Tax=Flavobacterium supellecticarium TaxID=2565924 RepID=A0A4S4A2W6_9FLAO|nr:MvdD family ATP-grasp ribosomal peptide maturase [Flavobacterium supellecticarium]THF52749.1 MvdD family ATP-grasp ribosomal peptide maturase [Flavobacterium supellecticarium]
MGKVLIITHSQDNECIDIVSEKIRKHGGEPIRFDVDEYPLKYNLSSCFENGEWKIYLDHEGNRVGLHDIVAVWYRRSNNLGGNLSEVLEREYLGSVYGEIRATFFGFLESLPCFQIGRYSKYRRLDSKEEQMRIADFLGMKVPETCITNSPQEAKRFVREHPKGVITKMQSSFAIERNGVENVVFTNLIKEEDLDEIETLQYCPMQFQEKLEKKVELRITIVGDAVFAFEIDSQKLDNAKLDWRREGVELLRDWIPYELPSDLKDKLLQMMDMYEINYGAIDVIVTPDDDYYFLEINSAGEFFWLDRLMENNPISEQIAKVLLGKANRRYTPVFDKNNIESLA